MAGPLILLDAKLGVAAVPLRLALGGAMLPLLLRATIEYRWEGAAEIGAWLGALALLGIAVGWAAAGLARAVDGPSAPLALLVATTGLAACTGLTGSAKLAQTVGLLCAGTGALWVVRCLRRDARLLPGDASFLVLVAFGLGLCAHFYSELPGTDALLLSAAVLAPRLAELPAFRAWTARRRAVLRVALALLPAAAAVTRAALAFDPAPAYEY